VRGDLPRYSPQPSMAMLRADYALFLDAPPVAPAAPRGLDVSLTPLATGFTHEPSDELFGPHVSAFTRAPHGAGFLLSIAAPVKGDAGAFFAMAHQTLLAAVAGREGWVLDVLKLWPQPVDKLGDLPDEPLPEDLFSIAFREQGEHGLRAETVGLSKLGQKELSFQFKGHALIEDATLLCAHFADWIFGQRRRVEGGAQVAFGLETLTFRSATPDGTPFRGWHPPLVLRLLSPERFPGVGALEVLGRTLPWEPAEAELTFALERSAAQRTLLEAHGLSGESPHVGALARACACLGTGPFVGTRVEPHAQRDSGWLFACESGHHPDQLAELSLGELARRVERIIPVLALPPGASARFDGDAVQLMLDRVTRGLSDGEDSDVSSI